MGVYIRKYIRKCKHCKCIKLLYKFANAGVMKGKHYKRYECKKCYNKIKKQDTQIKRNWMIEYKSTLQCFICGYHENQTALHFHHISKKDKKHNVSDMVGRGYSITNIKKEIRKCIVLCANCHYEYHNTNHY
jgi:hypothetical protein